CSSDLRIRLTSGSFLSGFWARRAKSVVCCPSNSIGHLTSGQSIPRRCDTFQVGLNLGLPKKVHGLQSRMVRHLAVRTSISAELFHCLVVKRQQHYVLVLRQLNLDHPVAVVFPQSIRPRLCLPLPVFHHVHHSKARHGHLITTRVSRNRRSIARSPPNTELRTVHQQRDHRVRLYSCAHWR